MAGQEKLKFDSRWFEKTDPEQRRICRERRFTKLVAGVVLAGGVTSLGAVDVTNNQQLADDSNSSIDVIASALDAKDNSSAILLMDGFNTPNADWLSEEIGPLFQHQIDAQVWSENYGNAPLSARSIATDAENLARKTGVHTVYLAGYSAGGDNATKVRQMISNDTNLDVPLTVMISSPSDLRDIRRNFNWVRDALMYIDSNPWLSWIEDTSLFQYVAEMGLEWNDVHNLGDLINVSGNVMHRMGSRQTPGGRLMIDQMLSIQTSHVSQQIKDAGKQQVGVKETIVYLGGDDTNIINYKQAGDAIQTDTKKAGLNGIRYNVKHTVHGDVGASIGDYKKAFEAIGPELQRDIRIQYNLSTLALRAYVAQHSPLNPDYPFDN